MLKKYGGFNMLDVPARGPFFIIPDEEVLNDWIKNGIRRSVNSKATMTISEKQVLLALAEHAPSSKENPITIVEITETLKRLKPTTRQATLENQVRRIAASLAEMTIFKREQIALLDARKQSCYTLRSPKDALTELEFYNNQAKQKEKQAPAKKNILPRERQRAMAAVRANLLKRKDIIYPVVDYNPAEPWSIQMITQLMERCSREHTRDKRQVIEAKVLLGGKAANVVAHTTTRNDDGVKGEVGLITASDAQTVMAIITLTTQYIERALEEGRPVINKIPLDVLDLCSLLGKRRRGGTRDAVVHSLMRVIYTTFTIKVSDYPGNAKLNEGKIVGAETDFRLVKKHIIGIEGSGDDIKDETAYAKRWFTLSLDDQVWQSLVEGKNTRLVHPGLLFESNGYIHKLYAHIKLHTPHKGSITRTTTELYSYFSYRGGITQFKSFLRDKLLENTRIKPKDKLPKTGQLIDFYGYRIKVIEEGEFGGHLTLIISLGEKEKGRIMMEEMKLKKRSSYLALL